MAGPAGPAPRTGNLLIEAGEHTFRLRLREKAVHTRGPWEQEVHHYRGVSRDSFFYRDRELPSGPYDAGASGQLMLELNPAGRLSGGRQSRFADRQSWTLEARLPYLFREIEDRIAEAEHEAEDRRFAAERAAEIAQREAEERKRKWLVLMDRAAERLLEDHRAAALRYQTEAWHAADGIRRFCDAAEAQYGKHVQTAEWLSWARAYAAKLDPLTQPPSAPEVGEVTLEDLQVYFPPGWSALGPEHGRSQRPYERW